MWRDWCSYVRRGLGYPQLQFQNPCILLPLAQQRVSLKRVAFSYYAYKVVDTLLEWGKYVFRFFISLKRRQMQSLQSARVHTEPDTARQWCIHTGIENAKNEALNY